VVRNTRRLRGAFPMFRKLNNSYWAAVWRFVTIMGVTIATRAHTRHKRRTEINKVGVTPNSKYHHVPVALHSPPTRLYPGLIHPNIKGPVTSLLASVLLLFPKFDRTRKQSCYSRIMSTQLNSRYQVPLSTLTLVATVPVPSAICSA